MTTAAGLPRPAGDAGGNRRRSVIGTAVVGAVRAQHPAVAVRRPARGRSACTPTRTGGWQWPTRPAREMLISCGAALFNIRLALRYLGWVPETSLLPDPGRPMLVARIS